VPTKKDIFNESKVLDQSGQNFSL